MTIVEVTAAPFGAGRSGGGERHAVEFIRELSKHEPVVASFGVPDRHPTVSPTELGCPARFVSFPPLLSETNPIPRAATWGLIGAYLRTHKGEVEFVHVHNLRTAMSSLWIFLAYLRKKDDRIRIVLTDLGARFFPLPQLTAAMVDYYAPISHVSEEALLTLGRRPSCVVPTAVSAPFLAGQPSPFSERSIDLLFVGRIVPWKRPDRVIELTKALTQRLARPVRTVVAGAAIDPEFLVDLRRRATELGVAENVEFVVGPSDGELLELYSRAKVYCLASDHVDVHGRRHAFPELSSITTLEAAARGTPALANRIPAALEQVHDGVTGFLVQPFGGPGTVEVAERLLTDSAAWSSASRAARTFVETERTYPATVGVFRGFLSQIRSGAA
jgi:glycosyltransferase involved in cell wall biosynthesis